MASETWLLNESCTDISTGLKTPFVCNGVTVSQVSRNLTNRRYNVFFDGVHVATSTANYGTTYAWEDDSYRRVTFQTPASGDLLTWLQSNGAKQNPVNKVAMGDAVLLDLTNDSVTPETLLQGATAHDASGNEIQGAAVLSSVNSVNGKTGDVELTASDVGAISAPSSMTADKWLKTDANGAVALSDLPNATYAVRGITLLSNSYDSTLTDRAVTPKALNDVYKMVQEASAPVFITASINEVVEDSKELTIDFYISVGELEERYQANQQIIAIINGDDGNGYFGRLMLMGYDSTTSISTWMGTLINGTTSTAQLYLVTCNQPSVDFIRGTAKTVTIA